MCAIRGVVPSRNAAEMIRHPETIINGLLVISRMNKLGHVQSLHCNSAQTLQALTWRQESPAQYDQHTMPAKKAIRTSRGNSTKLSILELMVE